MQTFLTTYEEYKILKANQDAIVDDLSNKLNRYPKGEMGLVVLSSGLEREEFNKIRLEFKIAFNNLRALNGIGVKKFKKQIQEDQANKRKLLAK